MDQLEGRLEEPDGSLVKRIAMPLRVRESVRGLRSPGAPPEAAPGAQSALSGGVRS
jgi:hypothetical protein